MPIDDNIIVTAAKAGKSIVGSLFDKTKEFLNDLVHPNMNIETIAQAAAPTLDDFILENEANGLKYSAGRFKVAYLDEEHFVLAFEMYFKDTDGKWYKANGESDPRGSELLDIGAWKTLQTLKSVEFPISAPKVDASDGASEQSDDEMNQPEFEPAIGPAKSELKTEPKSELGSKAESKSEISLESLLAASRKAKSDEKSDGGLSLDKD